MTTPRSTPTPATVLAWIAANSGQPWFPSRHARDTDIERDSLDEPLNRLRIAGLVRVETWVRGLGQGYVLTPAGEQAAATGKGIPHVGAPVVDSGSGILLRPLTPPEPSVADRLASLPIDTRFPVVVPTLLIANVLWFFVGVVFAMRMGIPLWSYLSNGNTAVSHRLGAVTGEDLMLGEWWRLLTCCFVHAHGLHLLLNLFVLGMMGPLAELLWGRGRLAVVYLVSGLAGSCFAMAHQPDALLVGASGAIWGVQMSLVAWFLLFRDRLPAEVAADWGRRLTLVVIINGAASLLPGVSWEAHLGGGIVGFLAAGLLNGLRSGEQSRRGLAIALLLTLPVACIAGLWGMKKWSEEWAPIRLRFATEAAWHNFDHEVVPLVNAVAPTTVRPVEDQVSRLLIRSPNRRDPSTVARLREKLTEFKALADAATSRLNEPPLGVPALDRVRTHARSFAEAQSRSLGLLLGMLAENRIPSEAAWDDWDKARRAANTAWARLPKR